MSAVTLSYVSDRTLVRDLAALILAHDFFARSPAGELFHYRAGVYRTGAEFFIRQCVKHLVLQLGRVEKWNRRLAEEVTEFILLDTLELETTPSLDFINLENGLLNIWSGHCQLRRAGVVWWVMIGRPGVASGRCHPPPDLEGSRSQESVIRRSQQMASYSKKILDDTVEGEKPLGLASRFESAYLPFPLARRLMRGFGAIVGETFRVVSHVAQDCSHGGRVAS